MAIGEEYSREGEIVMRVTRFSETNDSGGGPLPATRSDTTRLAANNCGGLDSQQL